MEISNLLTPPKGYKFLCPIKFKKIIILAPHCDDEVIGCGGTILNYLSWGANITIVYCTLPREKEIAALRKREAMSIWNAIENVNLVFWPYNDRELDKNIPDAINSAKEIIDIYEPEAILLPWMIDSHQDHQSSFFIICEAIKALNYQCDLHFYEIFYPVVANYIMNITNTFELKKDMMKKYKTQLRINFLNSSTYINMYRASCLNLTAIKYVEAFFVLRSDCLISFEKLIKNIIGIEVE